MAFQMSTITRGGQYGLGMLASSRMGLNASIRQTQLRAFSMRPGQTLGQKTPPPGSQVKVVAYARQRQESARSIHRLGLFAGASILAGAGLNALTKDRIACEPASRSYDAPSISVSSPAAPQATEPVPQSTVNVYQLSFGTVCGICAGIFIKKGAKFIAFLLGGGFVFLQYLSSQRVINVNWSAINSKYDKFINNAAGPSSGTVSGYRGSTAHRLWTKTTNFLMADFQPRATFMAGLLLGLRLG